ncbi:DUF3558 family protein [Embleya sp. NBC_00896]|uniref:DUF3558 family protein n=1 Tax=Embleya sp. NBC_00896 TaxID=2975961 RepID=UPI003869D1F6|nr:DUF3558 family protein [Embleya sp. NBC_00896]
MRVRIGVVVAALAVVLQLAACSDGDTKADGDKGPSPGATGAGDTGVGSDLRAVDACAVLTADQVAQVLALPGLKAAQNPLGCDYAAADGVPVISTIATRSKASGGVDKALEAYLGTLGDTRTEKVTGVGDAAVYVQPDTIGGVLVVAARKGDETAVFSLNAGGGEPPPTKDQLIALAKQAVGKL